MYEKLASLYVETVYFMHEMMQKQGLRKADLASGVLKNTRMLTPLLATSGRRCSATLYLALATRLLLKLSFSSSSVLRISWIS